MEYMTLISGVGLLAIFTWLLIRNHKRRGFIHAWLRIETVAGIVAGLYLIFTSIF